MKNKFDYIISNPPYAIGNQITKYIVDNIQFESYINLMPISKYKSKELYKNVKSLVVVDPSAFEDAAITDNLCVCELEKNMVDNTYEDLSLSTYKEEYREFYKLNNKVNHYAIKSYERTPKVDNIRYDYDSNKAFAITARTALDGVHKLEGKGSFDVDFNINKIKTIKDTNIWKHMDGSLAQSAVGYIYFNSEIEKDNLCRFWYYNPLMNKLIKGLNQTGGLFTIAIPNIDYSIERDYEHLTLDDIMQILKQENNL